LSNPDNGVAAIFLSRVKNGKPPIINEDGNQTRDFVYIKDIVKAVGLCMENDKANYQIFNVGSGVPTTINDVAEIVFKLNKSNIKPEVTGKFRGFDVRHCYADISKLKKIVGWEPEINFNQGMKEVFEWSKNEIAVDLVEKAMKELEEKGLR
jgi:dTDP-L-rhamnose 4-epimerase